MPRPEIRNRLFRRRAPRRDPTIDQLEHSLRDGGGDDNADIPHGDDGDNGGGHQRGVFLEVGMLNMTGYEDGDG